MSVWYWILFTLLCIGIQSFYSMLEMAMVSFNKVRLQYYVSRGIKRAHWIHHLLQNPARLFGTTLLAINIVLQVGSQCSREVYAAFDLDPDIAPFTQIFLVMIFAELAPMFAARRYVEHVAMLGIPIIYATSKIFAPLIYLIGWVSRIVSFLFGGSKQGALNSLSREELQHVVEAQEEGASPDAFNLLVANLFEFRSKTAEDAITPLDEIHMLPFDATLTDMRTMLTSYDIPCVPIYYQTRENIVSIALPRDLVQVPDDERLRFHARPPWFITKGSPLMQILKQFRHNNRTVAVVLDDEGLAVGLLTLEDILDEIFGEERTHKRLIPQPRRALIERTFAGTLLIKDFNEQFDAHLEGNGSTTLAELVATRLGTLPAEGDTVHIEPFELKVEEATLLGAKTISVRTVL